MSRQIPSYPNRYSATPITNAYGWFGELHIDFSTAAGRFVLNVNADAAGAAAGLPPIDRIPVALGQTVVPAAGTKPAVKIKSFAELMEDTEFAAAFATIRTKLYAEADKLPALAGATDVP